MELPLRTVVKLLFIFLLPLPSSLAGLSVAAFPFHSSREERGATQETGDNIQPRGESI